MEWETYYSRFYEWASSTQISRISQLTSFGPSAEVCEVVLALSNVPSASRLVKKALEAGVQFTDSEKDQLRMAVNPETAGMLADVPKKARQKKPDLVIRILWRIVKAIDNSIEARLTSPRPKRHTGLIAFIVLGELLGGMDDSCHHHRW